MVCIQGASRKIGGYGCIVEIDESKFVKRKYHKGKPKVCEDWVLGGVCRETGQCFMVIVPNRTRETLQSTSNATSMKGQLSSLIVGLHTTI